MILKCYKLLINLLISYIRIVFPYIFLGRSLQRRRHLRPHKLYIFLINLTLQLFIILFLYISQIIPSKHTIHRNMWKQLYYFHYNKNRVRGDPIFG